MADLSASPIVAAPASKAVNPRLLCPFTLQLWTIDRMLNFEVTDDPHYEGLELQVFDDPLHGRGMAVLVRRREDGRFDIYRQPGLTLDPAIAQVGGLLGEWLEAPIDPARFEVSPDGVDVDVGFTDLDHLRFQGEAGLPVDVQAPVGSSPEQDGHAPAVG